MQQNRPFETAPIKPTVSFADLDKIDVRVGTIVRVEGVAGADKLARFIVDFGDSRRTVPAGIKQKRGDPREMEGGQALFVVNLEPKKMIGGGVGGHALRHRLRRRHFSPFRPFRRPRAQRRESGVIITGPDERLAIAACLG